MASTFFVDGQGCVTSLFLTCGKTMVGIMKIMETSFKRICAHNVAFSAPNPAAGHCRLRPLPETPGYSKSCRISEGQ